MTIRNRPQLNRITDQIPLSAREILVMELLPSGKLLLWLASRRPDGTAALSTADRVLPVSPAARAPLWRAIRRIDELAQPSVPSMRRAS